MKRKSSRNDAGWQIQANAKSSEPAVKEHSRKESSSKKNRDPSMGDPDLQNRLGIISAAKATHKEIKYDNLYPFFVGVTTRLQRLEDPIRKIEVQFTLLARLQKCLEE